MSDIAATNPTVTVTVVLNPLKPKDEFERFVLPFEPNTKVSDYIVDVGDAVVGYRGEMLEDITTVTVIENSEIIVCPVPRGGGGGAKGLLRVIAFVAVAAFAGWAVGANGLFGSAGLSGFTAALVKTGIMVAGGVLINELLPFEQPDSGTSPTYGLSGPQNTAREGVIVPVCYGQHIMAGNRIGNYVENDRANKTQYFVSLYNLGEGPIAGVSNIRVNDQPIENYNDAIETPIIRFGESDQAAIDWFGVTRNPINLGSVLLTNNSWFTITTNQEIDDFSINFNLTEGLYARAKDGDIYRAPKAFQIRYRKVGAVDWTYVGSSVDHYENWYVINDGSLVETQTLPVGYFIQWNIALPYYRGVYKLVNGLKVWVGQVEARPVYTYNTWMPNIPNDGYPNTAEGPCLVLIDVSTSPLRFTIGLPGSLPEGFYEIQMRTVPYIFQYTNGGLNYALGESTAQPLAVESLDQKVYERVKYNNTALLALKVKITDTISNVPSVTFTHLGKKVFVRRLDDNTKTYVWSFESSSNPAWITYDAMTAKRYGGGYDPNEIDLDKFQEWADFCEEKNFTFNGVFDTSIPVWDAINSIARCGCAQLTMVGTKYSVFIDKAEMPSMMFNDANIVQGSVQVNWLPFADRANEIIVEFLDETNNFTNRTARIVGPDIPPNEDQKTISLSGFGITGIEQATKLATLQLNKNRRQIKTITFQTGVDSLAVGPGDVFAFQSGVMEWGFGGRIAAGSTLSVLNLDSPVEMVTGVNYKVALHYDYLVRATGTIHSVIGTYVYLNGFAGDTKVRTLKIGVNEYPVIAVIDNGAGLYGVQIKTAAYPPSGVAYSLYDLDVIETRAVANPGTGQYQSITLTSALPVLPNTKTRWMFGTEQQVEEKYRVIKVDSGSEGYTRTIEGLQYDDDVYADPTDILPLEPIVGYGSIGQVENLSHTVASRRIGAQTETVVKLFWNKPSSGAYGGARIYVSYGEFAATFQQVDSVINVTEWTDKTAVIGAKVTYKVVAFDSVGKTATLAGAPSVSFTIGNPTEEYDPPQNLVASNDQEMKIILNWEEPVDNPGNLVGYEVWRNTINARNGSETLLAVSNTLRYEDVIGVAGTFYYWVRALDTNGRPGSFNALLGVQGIALDYQPTEQEALDGLVDIRYMTPALSALVAKYEAVLSNAEYSQVLKQYSADTTLTDVDVPYLLDEDSYNFAAVSAHRAIAIGDNGVLLSHNRGGDIIDEISTGAGYNAISDCSFVGFNDVNNRAIYAVATSDGVYNYDTILKFYEVDKYGGLSVTAESISIAAGTNDYRGEFFRVEATRPLEGITGGRSGVIAAVIRRIKDFGGFDGYEYRVLFSQEGSGTTARTWGIPGNFANTVVPSPHYDELGFYLRTYPCPDTLDWGDVLQVIPCRGGFLFLFDEGVGFYKLTMSGSNLTNVTFYFYPHLTSATGYGAPGALTPKSISVFTTSIGDFVIAAFANTLKIYTFDHTLGYGAISATPIKTIDLPATTYVTRQVSMIGGLIMTVQSASTLEGSAGRICITAWNPEQPELVKTRILKEIQYNSDYWAKQAGRDAKVRNDSYLMRDGTKLVRGQVNSKFPCFRSPNGIT